MVQCTKDKRLKQSFGFEWLFRKGGSSLRQRGNIFGLQDGVVTCPTCDTKNPERAKFCFECGTQLAAVANNRAGSKAADSVRPLLAAASDNDTEWSGTISERKTITVLFADIVDSTIIVSERDPEPVRDIVGRAIALMSAQIARFDGYINETPGDGIIAFFGAPHAHEDDPIRAVAAAIAIQQAIAGYADELAAQHVLDDFRVRVGISNGLVVLGKLHSGGQAKYTAIGDTVNLAARLQSAASAGGILVSQRVYEQTSSRFRFHDAGLATLKGIATPTQVWQVEGDNADAPPAKPSRARLVGRESELAALSTALYRLRHGQGGIISVVGEAGIGKSRLLAEWRNRLPSGIRIAHAAAFNQGLPHDYLLWAELIRSLFAIPTYSDSSQARAQLEAAFAQTPTLADYHPAIARLLGLAGEQGLEVVDIATAVLRLLTAPAYAPLVIMLEDLHRADRPSLGLLRQLAPLTQQYPILIIASSRTDSSIAATLLEEISDQQLALPPLDPTTSTKMLHQLLDSPNLAEESVALILAQADGNPLYLEEMTASLVDRGLLVRGPQGWHMQKYLGLTIPPSLEAMIATRIDHLPETSYQVLQLASVLGRHFDLDMLNTLMQSVISSAMTELVSRGIIVSEQGGYSFSHTLTREVVHNGLLHQYRRHYHRLAAEYYLSRPLPHHPQSLADVQFLADAFNHYLQAEDYAAAYAICDKVISSDPQGLPLTFDEALDRWGENRLRRNLYLALAPYLEGTPQVNALGRLASAHRVLSEYAEAIPCYEQAIALAAQLGDRTAETHWLGMLGNLYTDSGDLAAALTTHERALQLTATLADPAAEAKWLANIAGTYLASGEAQQAIPHLTQALELARAIGDRRLEGQLLGNLGSAYGTLGDADQAITALLSALTIARDLDDRRGEMMRLGNLGVTYINFGQTAQAIDCLAPARDIAHDLGDRLNEAIWLGNLGLAYGDNNNHPTSLSHLHQAIDLSRDIEDDWGQATWLGYLGNEYCALGREAEAAKVYADAIEIARRHDPAEVEVVAESGVARILASQGHRAEALARLQPLLDNIPTRVNERVALFLNAACTFALLGDCARAASYLDQAAQLNPAVNRRALTDPHISLCSNLAVQAVKKEVVT